RLWLLHRVPDRAAVHGRPRRQDLRRLERDAQGRDRPRHVSAGQVPKKNPRDAGGFHGRVKRKTQCRPEPMPSMTMSMKASTTCSMLYLPLLLYQRGTQLSAPNSRAENSDGSQGLMVPSAMPSVISARTVLSSRRWNWRISPPGAMSSGREPTSTRQRPKSLF